MIREKLSKLTTKLFVIITLSAMVAISLFFFLYAGRDDVYLSLKNMGLIGYDNEEFLDAFAKQAIDVEVLPGDMSPPNDNDVDGELLELIQTRDNYTSIALYSADTQEYIAAYYAKALDYFIVGDLIWGNENIYITDEITRVVQFRDQEVEVVVHSYHIAQMLMPYILFCLVISAIAFVFPILRFIKQRMTYLNQVKEEILVMAQGELHIPVSVKGTDEIAVLAKQLDQLRITLDENIEQEKQSRKANHDLITSLSHDIRTPLTVLLGYLEIIKLQKSGSEGYLGYVDSCISKVMEIRDLSNTMFDYALLYDSNDALHVEMISLSDLEKYIQEGIEYLRVKGFHVKATLSNATMQLPLDISMFKRVINNLISNVIKYADANKGIGIILEVENRYMKIVFSNAINTEHQKVESNNIGIKSMKKIADLHQGTFFVQAIDDEYSTIITIPID